MVYENKQAIKEGTYWACAFSTNNTEKGMKYKAEPHQVKVMSRYTNRINYVYRLNKYGNIIKSSEVSLDARHFTDTKEECIELYNGLIAEHITFLEDLIEDSKACYIKGVESEEVEL